MDWRYVEKDFLGTQWVCTGTSDWSWVVTWDLGDRNLDGFPFVIVRNIKDPPFIRVKVNSLVYTP